MKKLLCCLMAMVVTSVMTSCEENGTNTLPPVEDFRVDVALNITCENEGCSSATQKNMYNKQDRYNR